MEHRFAFDLGTNSLGWCVLQLSDSGDVIGIENMGVRLFSDGREPKSGEPLAAARRDARGLRRSLARRRQRRRKLFRVLQQNGLFPSDAEAARILKTVRPADLSSDGAGTKPDTFLPYRLRVRALDEKLEPYELGRALFHLGVRRGFKSNRKDNAEESPDRVSADAGRKGGPSEKMTQGEKCAHLAEMLKEGGCRTLGEFLWNQHKCGQKVRFTPGVSFYPLRSMYKDEFDAIRKAQEPFYPDVDWDSICDTVFFQRPLRPVERGRCQYMDKPRTFKAMPSAQKYRILQDAYNLSRFSDLNFPEAVSWEQKEQLIRELDFKKELTFDKVHKLFNDGRFCRFNLETDARDRLKGNVTACIMREPKHFGGLWDRLSLAQQDEIVELLITADEDSDILPVLDKYDLTPEQKAAVLRIPFPPGTTALCKELTERLVSLMQEKRIQFDKALTELGYTHSESNIKKYDLLPYYGQVLVGSTMGAKPDADESEPEKKYGKIANPTVHVALNQTRAVVNALIKKYGKPKQVVVELSRELKSSKDEKKRKNQLQAKRAKENARQNDKIKELARITYPSRTDRMKYRLWEELGAENMPRRCLYCGENISATDLYSPEIEVEHILPFSRTLLNTESNLTVAHHSCNAYKGERSPYEAFGGSPQGYSWEEIMQRVNKLESKAKRGRFAETAMEEFSHDNKFIERQLTDNQYIARAALRYLQSVCDSVWPVNGGMTKLLRDKWDIDSVLKRKIGQEEIIHFNLKDEDIGTFRKNRYDHRHHALDALVIGLCDRPMVQRIATANSHRVKNRLEIPPLPFPRSDIIERTRQIVPSFKPDHGVQGKLSKETFLARIKLEEQVSIGDLTESDIENIKSDRVRNDFEELMAEGKDIKKVKKELKDVYPEVKLFRFCFANRMPLVSLKKENIKDIIDKKIREELNDFIEQHKDKKFEDILVLFSKQRGVKRIRCKTFAQSPIKIDADPANPLSVPRYLNPEDYFAAVIWEIPAAKEGKSPKYEAQYVRRTEVDKEGRPALKEPHPAARRLCQLHKNDYIEFSQDGVWKKARVAGFSATNNCIDIRPVFATHDIKSWIVSTQEGMRESGWKENSGQNYVSVNVLFGEYAAHKITVNPIGQVRRKM